MLFRIIGVPFYNEDFNRNEFVDALKDLEKQLCNYLNVASLVISVQSDHMLNKKAKKYRSCLQDCIHKRLLLKRLIPRKWGFFVF